MGEQSDQEFDVLLSFVREERDYARAIYDIAKANGLRIFLDEEFQHEIWGNHLVEYFDQVFRDRGRYVLILISASYCKREGIPQVERRAALDRMIQERSEYILPVKVDDSWISGLSRSTAYLDLRVHGVLGICENLVRKLRKTVQKLTVPPDVFVPRVPLGSLPANQLATYLLQLCSRPQVTAFGALVYDESNAALRKLLSDRDYWDALDKISGPHFEIFAVRDTERFGSELEPTKMELMTVASLGRSRSRGYYFSRLLKEYFGEDKTALVYPSFLLFLAEGGQVKCCRLIPLKSGSVEETFDRLSALFSEIASGIEEAGGPTVALDALWDYLKKRLLSRDYTLYIQHPPAVSAEAVQKLVKYVEE